jgi:pyridoxal phosphate enzyme (YggS family)
MEIQPTLAARVVEVRQRIAEACARAGRSADQLLLLAVTKSASPDQIRQAISLGLCDLGENRVQNLQQRRRDLPEAAVRWHMIGHLQRNKVRDVISCSTLIHSVDSLRLALEIDLAAGALQRKVPILLQVNASEEPQKYGCPMADAPALAEAMLGKSNLQLRGLMTMAELSNDPARIGRAFVRARELFESLRARLGSPDFRELSMGMSHDYPLAIAEGATIVRVGSALFGETSTQIQALETI